MVSMSDSLLKQPTAFLPLAMPLIAAVAITWLPRRAREAPLVLALQAMAGLAALASDVILERAAAP
jgi:hypothetical protein